MLFTGLIRERLCHPSTSPQEYNFGWRKGIRARGHVSRQDCTLYSMSITLGEPLCRKEWERNTRHWVSYPQVETMRDNERTSSSQSSPA